MMPVFQTRHGWPRGNCLMACVASILEEPLSAFPDLFDEGSRRGDPEKWWWGILLEALAERGLTAVYVDGPTPPIGYACGSVALAGVCGHAVVTFNGDIVHDPHPLQPTRGMPPTAVRYWFLISAGAADGRAMPPQRQ